MTAGEKRVRATVTGAYSIVCFSGLFYYTYGSFFCSRPGGASHVVQTLRLAVACTVWELLASVCGAFAAKKSALRGLAPVVSTLLAFAGFVSITFWIYDSGRFVFEGTWADVSCFFTEGYGMMFPLVVAPALAVATLVGELVILKARGKPQNLAQLRPE